MKLVMREVLAFIYFFIFLKLFLFTILNIQSREAISKTIFYTTSLIMTMFGRETTRATEHYIPQETDITFLSKITEVIGKSCFKPYN